MISDIICELILPWIYANSGKNKTGFEAFPEKLHISMLKELVDNEGVIDAAIQ